MEQLTDNKPKTVIEKSEEELLELINDMTEDIAKEALADIDVSSVHQEMVDLVIEIAKKTNDENLSRETIQKIQNRMIVK